MPNKNILQRYAIWAYFLLVYGLAWGGVSIIARSFPASSDPTTRVALVSLPMLFAPAVSAFILTAVRSRNFNFGQHFDGAVNR